MEDVFIVDFTFWTLFASPFSLLTVNEKAKEVNLAFLFNYFHMKTLTFLFNYLQLLATSSQI